MLKLISYQLKDRWRSKEIFSVEAESWRDAIEAAVKAKADLNGLELRGIDLSFVRLDGVDLSNANLSFCNLCEARLRGARLRRASLRGAYLWKADLREADLEDVDLEGCFMGDANLDGVKNMALSVARTRILPAGDLIGWKQCEDGVIVKLLIPAAARRSHAFSRKCRCEYAVVLEVIGGDVGISMTTYYQQTKYRKGETVRPQRWDENWTWEGGGGIHFYITREEAESPQYEHHTRRIGEHH